MAKKETNDSFIKEIKDNYKEAVDGWADVYDEVSDDIRFVYDIDNGQWPETIRMAREADGRPVITSNKLQKILRRIRGDGMMNRPSLKVIPVDDKADIQKAELHGGLLRQIEYLSSADIAYDTAYNHAISSSVGFFRIKTYYADDNTFEQSIGIDRILNQLSVHYDPFAVQFNYEDARYCFVEDLISKDRFKKLYPGAELADFDSSTTSTIFGDWLQQDKVRVAEYFYKDYEQKKIVMLDDGTVVPAIGDVVRELVALGANVIDERTVDSHVVKWVKTNGVEVLEEAIWPGKYIPIIPMFGDEVVVDGKRHYLSLARGAKGLCQMHNYWITAATEAAALTPKMPFIVDHRQIKGFENEWEEANIKNRMYIRYNAVAGLNKPSREPQGQVPAAMVTMAQQAAYDIEDHLGDYQASKGEASNERSGKAINARINQSDKGTYLFINNRTRAMIYAGRQILDLIPKVYDTPRALRVMGEDGTQDVVGVNQPRADGSGIDNDLSVGEYDLVATVGASYSSKRQEMVEDMKAAMQYAPDLAPIIAPLMFKYSDSPGSQEIAAELQKAMQQMQQAPQ